MVTRVEVVAWVVDRVVDGGDTLDPYISLWAPMRRNSAAKRVYR